MEEFHDVEGQLIDAPFRLRWSSSCVWSGIPAWKTPRICLTTRFQCPVLFCKDFWGGDPPWQFRP